MGAGGGKKRGEENLTNNNPPKGVLNPPPLVRYVFHPSQVSVLCFSCTKIHDRADQKVSFGGVQKLSGECVLWYVFLPPPPYVLHPPYHGPNRLGRFRGIPTTKFRQEKRAQRLTVWVRRPPSGVGVFHAKGWCRRVCALPRKFVFLGFRREESGMSREFCRDVRTPGGVQKVCAQKTVHKCLLVCFVSFSPHIGQKALRVDIFKGDIWRWDSAVNIHSASQFAVHKAPSSSTARWKIPF